MKDGCSVADAENGTNCTEDRLTVVANHKFDLAVLLIFLIAPAERETCNLERVDYTRVVEVEGSLVRAKESDVGENEGLRQAVSVALNLMMTYVMLELEKFGEAKAEVHR